MPVSKYNHHRAVLLIMLTYSPLYVFSKCKDQKNQCVSHTAWYQILVFLILYVQITAEQPVLQTHLASTDGKKGFVVVWKSCIMLFCTGECLLLLPPLTDKQQQHYCWYLEMKTLDTSRLLQRAVPPPVLLRQLSQQQLLGWSTPSSGSLRNWPPHTPQMWAVSMPNPAKASRIKHGVQPTSWHSFHHR